MHTKPQHETRVVFHLGIRAAGVEPFLPKIEVVRRRANRRVARIEPLFPSYLFLNMHLTPETLKAVQWTPGARRLLGDGEMPMAVPEEFVQRIRERTEPLGFVRVGLGFKHGYKVLVKSGPFAGLEAVFDRPMGRQGRVHVLLQILGTLTPLEIDALDLERI